MVLHGGGVAMEGAWLRMPRGVAMEGAWLRIPRGVAMVAVAVILLSHPLAVESKKFRCPCANVGPMASKVHWEEHGEAMRYHELLCCPEALLPQVPNNYTITWLVNGEPLPLDNSITPSFRPDPHCGPETLESKEMYPDDEGNYTCTITALNGTHLATRTTKLCVAASEEYETPVAPVMSGNQYALPRERAELWCQGYVGLGGCGTPRDHSVTWTKVNNDGSTTPARDLPNVHVNTRPQQDGKIVRSDLTVSSVESRHFGLFVCTIKNSYGATALNATLIKGVHPDDLKAGQYRAAVLVMAMAAMVTVVMVVVWWRCRLMVKLYLRDKTHLKEDCQDECLHDVFVVHGDSSARWVWSVLVPRLENVYGYTCYLPDRDLHGGALLVDEVAEAVSRSRCVVVVVTGDLLASPWTTWALHQGINNTLTTNTNIVGLVMQRLKEKENPEDSCKTRKILNTIRNIDIPYCLRAVETSVGTLVETPISRATKGSIDQSLSVPKSTEGLRSRSKSPKNKPVIEAPGKCQDIMTGKDVKEERKTVKDARKEENKGKGALDENTVSPCALTPFLFPCRSRRTKPSDSGVVGLGSVLRLVCIGDPEQLFWQRVRLTLGPPSHLRHNQHRSHRNT